MRYRIAVVLGLSALTALGGDWSPRRAADYMDARQKEWFEWPRANGGAKPCISCHTSLPYLMARPALRRVLGEQEPTQYETGLLASLRSRIENTTPDGPSLGVESVMAALFLRTPGAFDRMWKMQIRDGKSAGAWKWFSLNDDPYEQTESDLFGASLAAMAVSSAPEEYRKQPEVRERVAALTAYLRSPHEGQPLHNWLAVAWASSKLPEVMDDKARRETIRTALDKQQPDGGWSIESLGPWKAHPDAPAATGTSGYATAFTTMVLFESGVSAGEPKMARALAWLRTHQDRVGGYWNADSMNHQYKQDSMEIRFMRDVATGFAARVLLEVEEGAGK